MYHKTWKHVCLAALVSVASVAAPLAMAKKPPKPPPEPEFDGAACVDSGSDFPAFVYAVSGELFLSNAAGDCSISLYKADWAITGNPSYLSYRLLGSSEAGTGKVAWTEQYRDDKTGVWEPYRIYLSTFELVNEVVEQPETNMVFESPLSPTEGGGTYASDLSFDGSKILLDGSEDDGQVHFIEEFDLETQELLRIFESGPEVSGEAYTVHRPVYGIEDRPNPRVYFEFADYPDDRRLVFIEFDGENWSDPNVLRTGLNAGLGEHAVGLWGPLGPGSEVEVIAMPREVGDMEWIDIIGVDACLADPDDPGCVITTFENSARKYGPSASFTSFGDSPPDLLYMAWDPSPTVCYAIMEFNLDLDEPSWRAVYPGLKGCNRDISYWGVDAAD